MFMWAVIIRMAWNSKTLTEETHSTSQAAGQAQEPLATQKTRTYSWLGTTDLPPDASH